jgi:hypothetical protein
MQQSGPITVNFSTNFAETIEIKKPKFKIFLEKCWKAFVECCKFLFKNPHGFRLFSIIIAIVLTGTNFISILTFQVPFLCFKFTDEHPYASTVTGIALGMSFLWVTNSVNLGGKLSYV